MQKSSENPQVLIVGLQKLQNALLTSFLGKSAGLQCLPCHECDLKSILATNKHSKQIILWDCLNTTLLELDSAFGVEFESIPSQCFVAFFNVCTNSGIETYAVKLGVHGIFFENNPLKILL